MYMNYACRQLVDFLSLEGWGWKRKRLEVQTIEVLGPTELLKIKRKEGQTDLTKRILIEKSTSDIKNHKNLQNFLIFFSLGFVFWLSQSSFWEVTKTSFILDG